MIAFGEQKQAARRLEIERTAARAQRAKHDSAGRGERLFGRPQAIFALGRADEDETGGIEAELQKARRVRRALLGEHALLAGPNYARLPCPTGGKAQTDAKSGRFRPGPRRTELMQRLAGH